MSLIACPKCAAQLNEGAATCTSCGCSLPHDESAAAPISRLGGKLEAVGTLMIAASIISIVMGAWWGAALLFPSVVVFMLGRMT